MKNGNYFALFVLFFLSKFLLFAQVNPIQNQINFSESDTISVEDNLVDTEEDFDEYDDDLGAQQSMMFVYFSWMPGYHYYSNFDVLKVHYVHDKTIKPDTLILGHYVHPAKLKPFSKYGVKRRRGRRHWGIDISYPEGTPVVAAFDGIVRVSTYNNGGYGNLVILRHENQLETYYAHLIRRLVNPGQLVKAGDTIGHGGNTGRSRGNHLHFETRYLGAHFNPEKIIDFYNYKLAVDTLFVGGKEVKTTAATTAKTPNDPSGQPVGTPFYVTVKRGETLGLLAQRHRTYVDKIRKLNNMKNDFLREGQRLRIR